MSTQENNGPGLQGNLVDPDGFPRADIDVVRVRQQRHRLAVLKNDHSNIMSQLQSLMHVALAPPKHPNHVQTPVKSDVGRMTTSTSSSGTTHAANSGNDLNLSQNNEIAQPDASQSQSQPQPQPQPQTTVRDNRVPFALVDSVAPESPSAEAGLQVNDRIVAFGAISLRSFSTPADAMAALPGLLSSHENIPIDVIVHREGSSTGSFTLRLTPKRWSGRGMLGCHVVPTEASQVDNIYAPDVATMTASRASTQQ